MHDSELAFYDARIAPILGRHEESRQRAFSAWRNLSVGVAALALILAGVLSFTGPDQIWVLALLGGGVGVLLLYLRTAKLWSGPLSSEVIAALCEEVGDVAPARAALLVEPFERLGVVGRCDKVELTSPFEGQYRGQDYAIASADLGRTSRGKNSSSTTVFQGLLLRIALPAPAPRLLLIRNLGSLGSALNRKVLDMTGHMKQVTLGIGAVEQQFDVRAEDAEAARGYLTGPVIRALQVLVEAERDNSAVTVGFDETTLLVALPRIRQVFRMGSLFRPLADLRPAIMAARVDLTLPRRVIDALLDG